MFGRVLQFRAGHADFAQRGIGEELLHFADRLLGIALDKFARIDAIDVGEADQHLDGDRALVALHEIEITRGNVEFLGHARLGDVALAPEPFEARAGENLAGTVRFGRHV